MKLVGDANVPRGKVSFRSLEGEPSDPAVEKKAKMQVRSDIDNPDAFKWIEGAMLQYDATEDKWKVQHPMTKVWHIFARTTQEEVDEAAKGVDYSQANWRK